MDGEGDPPPELILAWSCERWNCLPETGGYYDQDHQTVYRMAVFSNIYAVVSKLRNAKGEQIHRLTEADRKLLRKLVDMGLLFSG